MENTFRHWAEINKDMFKACLNKDKESQKNIFVEALNKNVALKQINCIQATLFRG